MDIPLIGLQKQIIQLLRSDMKNHHHVLGNDAAKNMVQFKINAIKSFSKSFSEYLDNLSEENNRME